MLLDLYARRRAGWADAARMEPFSVGVEGVFGHVRANGRAVTWGEGFYGVSPGVTLHFNQLQVSLKVLVVEQGMSNLVKERRNVMTIVYIGDGVLCRVPMKDIARYEGELWEIGA